MHACEICGMTTNLDRHHIVPKRMGGRKNPAIHHQTNLMTLCRRCHQKLHDENWEVVRSQDGVWVFDKHTGNQVMRRLSNPSLDVPSIFQLLNAAEDSLARITEFIPYFTDDQLVEAFNYATAIGKRSWLIRASILYETQQRSSYGEHALESMAWRFGISRRQAWKYVQVWKAFFVSDVEKKESVNVDTFSFAEPSWYVIAATETNDPKKWLSYAQDRKAEDPRYSVSWFRQDIQLSRLPEKSINGQVSLEGLEITVELPSLENRACPWIRRLCVKSGKPVSLEECQDCEFERGAAES